MFITYSHYCLNISVFPTQIKIQHPGGRRATSTSAATCYYVGHCWDLSPSLAQFCTGCSALWQRCQTCEVTDFRGHGTTAQRSPVLPFPSSRGGLHQLPFLGTCQGCPEVLPAARHVVNSACCQQLPAARRWQARQGAFAEVRDTLAKPGGGSHQVTVLSQRRLLANAKSLHKKGQKSLSGKAGMNLL